MAHEKVIDVDLYSGDTKAPARLYVRFDDSCVYLCLRSNEVEQEVIEVAYEVEGGNQRRVKPTSFLQALALGLLPSLPDDTSLEVNHTVEILFASGQKATALLLERVAGERIAEEETAAFTLRLEVQGHTYEVSDPEDIFYCFRQLAQQMKGICRICAYCALAKTMNYGADDWRHGLYCFRDDPSAYERVKYSNDPLAWSSQSWSNVDAFHTCPSYELADWCKPLVIGAGIESDPPGSTTD